MAQKINSSKLLPSAKTSSALVPFKTSSITLSSKNSTSKPVHSKIGSALVKRKEGDEKKEAKDVNNKLKLIEGVFKSELSVFRKKTEVKREDKEKKDFEEAEKKLETPKTRRFKFSSISIPKMGFMDRVNRFLFFTALGWLFPRILDLLPKLEEFAKKLKGIGKFFGFIFEKLHDGFTSLVKFGSTLKDKTLGFISDIPGAQEFGKKFSELEKQFSLFTDVAIVATVLAGDIGLTVADELDKLRKERKPKGGSPEEVKPKGEKPPTTKPKGGKPPTTELRGKIRPKGPTVKPKAPSFWDKILKGPFAKLKGPLARFGSSVIPGIGAIAGAADAYARFQSGDKIGGTLASISAGLDGITAVLAITGIGAPVAAALGTISMSIDALLLIRDIIKAFFPLVPMFSKGGRVIGKYQGGGTTRGGTSTNKPIKRTIKPITTRPPKIQPEKSKPGKNIGGEGKIKRLYPDPKENQTMPLDEWLQSDRSNVETYAQYVDSQRSRQQQTRANPYKVLTTAATKFKELPMGLGNIIGAAIDSSLGQKVDVSSAVKQFSSGLNYLFETYMNQRGSMNKNSLEKDINSFANGGFVPISDQSRGLRNSMNFGQMISKILEPEINSKINDILDTVKKEVQKKGVSSGTGDGGVGDPLEMQPGQISVTSNSPDFWLLVVASLFENGLQVDGYQGAADVAQAIYNRVSLPGWPKNIRDVILAGNGGQFEPVRKYGGVDQWRAINSKDSAIAFARRHGQNQSAVESVAAALLDTAKQQKARDFVGPRDSFRSVGNEQEKNQLDDNTERIRHGHVFGFEPGGRNIAAWRARQLRPATVSPSITGQVQQDTGSGSVNSNNATLSKLGTTNNLFISGPGYCTKGVIMTMENNGIIRPNTVTGDDLDASNNPRGLIIGMITRYGWVSLPGVGRPFTLRSSSGQTVRVNTMTHSEYVAAVNSNLVPSGALVFQTSQRDWNAPGSRTSRGFDSAIARNGGRNLFNGVLPMHGNAIYSSVKQVIVLVPRNSISATSSSTSSSTSNTSPPPPQLPPPPGQTTPGQGGRVSIYSGHADMLRAPNSGPVRTTAEQIQFGTNGGIEKIWNSNYYTNEAYINDLVARRVAQKASNVAAYRQPIRVERGRQQGSNWERAKEDILRNGITPFEIHHDEPAGRRGLLMDNYRSRLSNRYIKALDGVYGPHANPGNRSKLGFQVYGGAILEVSALTPEILKNRSTINNHVNRESTRIASALQNAARMRGGGPVDTKSISSYTDYSYGSRGSIAIQPIIIRQSVPVPIGSSGDAVMFPVPIPVNSNTDTEYNRSRGY